LAAPDTRQTDLQPLRRPNLLGVDEGDRHDGCTGLEGEPGRAALERPLPVGQAGALREDADQRTALDQVARGGERLQVALPATDRHRAERLHEQPDDSRPEQLRLGDVADRPVTGEAEHERIDRRLVIGDDDAAAAERDASPALDLRTQQHRQPRLDQGIAEHAVQTGRRPPQVHRRQVARSQGKAD
jgi:hypothetical protein